MLRRRGKVFLFFFFGLKIQRELWKQIDAVEYFHPIAAKGQIVFPSAHIPRDIEVQNQGGILVISTWTGSRTADDMFLISILLHEGVDSGRDSRTPFFRMQIARKSADSKLPTEEMVDYLCSL